jgi:hypothetical protein
MTEHRSVARAVPRAAAARAAGAVRPAEQKAGGR